MMKSSNLKSLIDVKALDQNIQSKLQTIGESSTSSSSGYLNNNTKEQNESEYGKGFLSTKPIPETLQEEVMDEDDQTQSATNSLASLQLSSGVLRICEPPLFKARSHLKELIAKQNKIYIDLSTEKFKLDNAEMAKLQSMMNDVKVYREKLIKIKKQMQNIYQRTKNLKKRAINIQASKQKELQRKLQKQQQEESLIGKQVGSNSASSSSIQSPEGTTNKSATPSDQTNIPR